MARYQRQSAREMGKCFAISAGAARNHAMFVKSFSGKFLIHSSAL
jgi:hypothetical protein